MLALGFFGAAVLCGGATLHFKNQADEAFDKYQTANTPDLMNKYFDETRKYDTYSSISFGGFQVSLLASVYFLIKSL